MDLRRKAGEKTVLKTIIARSLYILHPGATFLYLAGFLTLLCLFNHPAIMVLLFALTMGQAFYFAGTTPVAKAAKGYALFAPIMVVVTMLVNRRGLHVLFYLFDRPVTAEAMAYGMYTLLMMAGMLTVFLTLNQVLGSGKILYLFARIAPQTAFITNMTLRFSSVLKDKAVGYMQVQNTREQDNQELSRFKKAQNSGKLLGAFALWTLEEGMMVAEVLKAKAYGKHRRTFYTTYPITLRDVVFALVTGLLLVTLVGMKLSGLCSYNYLRNLTPVVWDNGLLITLGLVLIYGLLPFLSDCIQHLFKGA